MRDPWVAPGARSEDGARRRVTPFARTVEDALVPLPTALLFQTHFFDRGTARAFERLRRQCPPNYECIVLLHAPPGERKPRRLGAVPHHYVTTPEIRALPYPRKNAERDANGQPWALWQGGHCDLIPLHFFNAHPGFERYWVVEYDVHFTGHWSQLFRAFEDSDADFLSAAVRRHEDHPLWQFWGTLRDPSGGEVRDEDRLVAFMPLYRVSRRGLAALDAAYREGWGGHIETTWPTILAARGMVLEDIGGAGPFVRPGNIDRFYTIRTHGTTAIDPLTPGTLVGGPTLYRPGSTPNRLYHPVKPFKIWPEFKLMLWELRVWQGARRREALAWARGLRRRTTRG